ncbi:MAG: hypothetical protein JST66_16575 [Bacteroidetes bacterium]|nr:hypothetical protein [Bacteroidota bacterium]
MDDQKNATGEGGRAVRRVERQQMPVDGRRPPRVKDQRWPGTVMAFGLFISLFTLLWLGRRTFIDALTLLRWMAVLCMVGTLLPYGWSGLRLGMEKLEWFLFNVLAIGPLGLSALLAINHYVHGPVQWREASLGNDIIVPVEQDGAVVEHRIPGQGFFYFPEEELDAATSGRYRVGVAKGCLGYWSITDAEVVP